MDLGNRVRWEQDARGRLLILDCSNDTLEEAYALFYAYKREVSSEPPKSVRMLMIYHNHSRDRELSRLWRGLEPEYTGRVFKTALVGIGGEMVAVLGAYRMNARAKGRDIDETLKDFGTEAEARAWLAAE